MRAKNKLKEEDRKRKNRWRDQKWGKFCTGGMDGQMGTGGRWKTGPLLSPPPPPDDVVLTGALVFVWLTRRCSGARSNPVLVRCRTSSTLCFYNIKKKKTGCVFSTCAVDIWELSRRIRVVGRIKDASDDVKEDQGKADGGKVANHQERDTSPVGGFDL